MQPDSCIGAKVDCPVLSIITQLLRYTDVVGIDGDCIDIRPIVHNPLKTLCYGHNLPNNIAFQVLILLAEEGELRTPILKNQCCRIGDILPLPSIRKYL